MVKTLNTIEFLAAPGPILDVRSPGEYTRGHIPRAESFPLFTDEERTKVGTCYKRQGREQAIELGLTIVGPKLGTFVNTAKTLTSDKQVRVHCWRGGMRSSSMAWLLETAGLQVSVLQGGYKAFRNWVLSTLGTPKTIIILGGLTGTGKTDILQALTWQGEQVLDLEKLANHRGSSYGNLNLQPQPRDEHFQNQIACQWVKFNNQYPVWIEAESRRIGTCRIPDALFQQMECATVLQITKPRSQRIDLLLKAYGRADPNQLIAATERLRKRLGGLRTQQAVNSIRNGELAAAIALVLDYYDKTYTYDLQKRQTPIYNVDVTGLSSMESAILLKKFRSKLWPERSTLD